MTEPVCQIERASDTLKLIDLPHTSLVLLTVNAPGEGAIILGEPERHELIAALEAVEQESKTDGE